MRVSVSLSDRGGDDWRDHALCASMDPKNFDDAGTPIAWNACRQCPVKPHCLRDARTAPDPVYGVYRAGRAWGSKPKPAEPTVPCKSCGQELARRNEDGIRVVYPEGKCTRCRNLRRNPITLRSRIAEWRQYSAEGLSIGQAAARMGIEDQTLRKHLRRARNRGLLT